MLTTDPTLTPEERQQLEAMDAPAIERWIQARSNALNELTKATRARNIAAGEILAVKNDKAYRALKAQRPANFPPMQTVGVQKPGGQQ